MTASFSQRLDAARRLLAIPQDGTVPVGLQDQLDAASSEAHHIYSAAVSTLTSAQPDRAWRSSHDDRAGAGKLAYLWAGMMGCTPCSHLRRSGPQASIAMLALRRIDCRRCCATARTAPAEEADRCDLCGERGVEMFVPLAVQCGLLVITGDICTGCAGTLGIEVAA